MRTLASQIGKYVDCRQLQLSGYYWGVRENEYAYITQSLIKFIQEHFGNVAVIDWNYQNHSLKDPVGYFNSHAVSENGFLWIDGDVRSDVVYNKTSLRQYEKQMAKNSFGPAFSSVDYPAYRQEYLPSTDDRQAFKAALLNLFSLEGKINYRQNFCHDLHAHLINSLYNKQKNIYAGKVTVELSCYSFSEDLDNLAKDLLNFANDIVNVCGNVNFTIGIGQTANDYIKYFVGEKINDRYSKSVNEIYALSRTAQYLYLTNVGWANIISPVLVDQAGLLGAEMPCTIQKEVFANGSCCIVATDPISSLTIQRLKEIKKVLYNALCPTRTDYEIDYPRFRSQWQNVPVLDGEIEIIGNCVIFQHLGLIDEQYLYKYQGDFFP